MKNCSNSSNILFEEFKKLTTATPLENVDESEVKVQNECEIKINSPSIYCSKQKRTLSSSMNVANESHASRTIIEKIVKYLQFLNLFFFYNCIN